MRASVIIVSYNSRAELARCLPSVLEAGGSDCEIIVVDNASTDGSAEFVQEEFPEVCLVVSKANAGFGSGSNLGASYARGESLVFLNPDTVVEEDWLDALLDVLSGSPEIGMTTSRVLLLDDPGRVNACGNDVHFTGLTLCRGMGRAREEMDEAAEVGAVSGAAFAMRRSLFEELGGFDEEFFLYLEDTDLSLRTRLAGYRILYVPKSVVMHDYRLQFGPNKTFFQERNRYRMLLKCLQWRTLAVILPALLLAELVTWGFVFVGERRNFANKLRAYAWSITHWRETMERRRGVQASRRISDRRLLDACVARLEYGQVSDGVAGRAADILFNPVFALLHRLALRLAAGGRGHDRADQ